MRDAMDIAEYVLWYCENKLKNPITNLQLQKFLYYIQGANLAVNGESMFDNLIEAWKYGPVVPDVYYWYNENLSNAIRGVEIGKENTLSREEEIIINAVVELLISVNPWDVVKETHKEKPWKETYSSNFNEEIPVEMIREYFINNGEEIWNKFRKAS